MARHRLALVLSATGSLELRFVSAANNNTSRILLGLVNVSNDGRTSVVACLTVYPGIPSLPHNFSTSADSKSAVVSYWRKALYSRTSIPRTPMARLPWLIRTCFRVPTKFYR